MSRVSLGLTAGLAFAVICLAAQVLTVTGTWRGESVCASSAPACHNENVVYYIKDVPGHPNLVSIQADKVVDGKAVTMGTSQWQYDSAKQTLEWRTAQQTWNLKISGNHIEGTLTMADQTVFRKMTLEKEK